MVDVYTTLGASILALFGVLFGVYSARRTKIDELRYPDDRAEIKDLRMKVAGLEAAQIQTINPEWRKDHNRRYIYVNDVMAGIMFSVGVTREKLIGKTDTEIFDGRYPEFVGALDKLHDRAQRNRGTAAIMGVLFPGTSRMYTAIKEINTSLGEPVFVGRAYNDHIFARE